MRAHGIDISKWQSFYIPVPNPPRPVDFVIQRVSYGMKTDEGLLKLQPGVLQAPIKGAYHYYSSAVGWQAQCDLLLSLLDPYDFWAWDVEKAYNVNSDSFIYGVPRALEYLAKHSGKPGVIYTGPSVWVEWLSPVQAELRKFDLWTANYWWNRVASNPKILSTMRPDWRFWQYDDKGGGNQGKLYGVGSYGLDLNTYNGTVEQLHAWAKPVPPKLCPTCGQVIT
jgi:GH25 family lysozyme M1 (1,4-beta-N-acetylmuramidase)